MKSDKNNSIKISYVTPFTLLFSLIFFLAKIFGYIDWSWWWIFSPLWIPGAIIVSLVILGVLFYLFILSFIAIIEAWK